MEYEKEIKTSKLNDKTGYSTRYMPHCNIAHLSTAKRSYEKQEQSDKDPRYVAK